MDIENAVDIDEIRTEENKKDEAEDKFTKQKDDLKIGTCELG